MPNTILLPYKYQSKGRRNAIPILLGHPSTANNSKRRLSRGINLLTTLRAPSNIQRLLPLRNSLIIPTSKTVIVGMWARTTIRTRRALGTIIRQGRHLTRIVRRDRSGSVIPRTYLILITKVRPMRRTHRIPTLMRTRTSNRTTIRINLTSSMPTTPNRVLLMTKANLRGRVRLTIILRASSMLTTRTTYSLTRSTTLLLSSHEDNGRNMLDSGSDLIRDSSI